MTLPELFDLAASRHASDIHLATGESPRLRIAGSLVTLDETLDLPTLLAPILHPEARSRLSVGIPVERTLVHGDLTFNGVLFRAGEDGLVATFRILAKGVPPFDRIMEGAEAFFRGIVERRRGLVVVSGPTGSGKTTTALSIVNAINEARADRIFVVSSGASHVFESKRGLVTHLRVGQDCDGYLRALEIAHRSDLDAVTVDDLPTLEVLRQAVLLAETGHLVVANLHAESAAGAVARLVGAAGDEAPALRRTLADCLVAVIGQRLLPRHGSPGKVPIYEWIANTLSVREAILSGGDLAKVQAADPDCRTVGEAVRDVYMQGKIRMEDAMRTDPDGLHAGVGRTEVRAPGAD